MRVPAQQIRRQLVSVFRAWGMSEAHADTTADMMVETDLGGVDRGVIGMVTSATRGVTMVPTFGAEPVMGTNPLAFAAPAKRNAPFELDMATTTVAAGKVRVYKLNHKPLPAGWVVDGDGRTVTDSAKGFQHVSDRDGGITPLGGSREAGSHKGYGLAVMVHVLAGTLAGASFSPIRNQTQKKSDPHNIGHF